MKTNAPDKEVEVEELDFKPLTAQEAEVWRSKNPALSVWKVLVAQALTGLMVAVSVWFVTGVASVGWSAAHGAVSVVVPAALFARGVFRHKVSVNPRAAVVGFFGWEIVKIVLTVALLAAAPRLVPDLNWLALLAGMVITMKAYWVALWVWPGVRQTD